MNVTQAHVGQFLTVRNERGGQFRGEIRAVTPRGTVIMEVRKQLDGGVWVTLKRPELRTIERARIAWEDSGRGESNP